MLLSKILAVLAGVLALATSGLGFQQELAGPVAPDEALPDSLADVVGRVNADDFPSLQAAVDALGQTGGEVRLSAKVYVLDQPVVLSKRIRFQGVMDSKVRTSVTIIKASPKFEGDWLFVTSPIKAKDNEDLNRDIMFFDLNFYH